MSEPFFQITQSTITNDLGLAVNNKNIGMIMDIYQAVSQRYRDRIEQSDKAKKAFEKITPVMLTKAGMGDFTFAARIAGFLTETLMNLKVDPIPEVAPPPPAPVPGPKPKGGRRSAISKKFDKCVKSVRKTVKPRKDSNKESAAIAICATSVLYPHKRTIKRYRKGRLVTQRRKAF